MIDAKLRVAQELLRAKKYEAARTILETIKDNVIAKDWLGKLEKIVPTPKSNLSRTILQAIAELPQEFDYLKTSLLIGNDYFVANPAALFNQLQGAFDHPSENIRRSAREIIRWIAKIVALSNASEGDKFWIRLIDDDADEIAILKYYLKNFDVRLAVERKKTGIQIEVVNYSQSYSPTNLNQALLFEVRGYQSSKIVCIIGGYWQEGINGAAGKVEIRRLSPRSQIIPSQIEHITSLALEKAEIQAFDIESQIEVDEQNEDDWRYYMENIAPYEDDYDGDYWEKGGY